MKCFLASLVPLIPLVVGAPGTRPSITPALWVAQPGDTVDSVLGRVYDAPEDVFRRANPFADPNHIIADHTYTVEYKTPLPPQASASWSARTDVSPNTMYLKFARQESAETSDGGIKTTDTATPTLTSETTGTNTPKVTSTGTDAASGTLTSTGTPSTTRSLTSTETTIAGEATKTQTSSIRTLESTGTTSSAESLTSTETTTAKEATTTQTSYTLKSDTTGTPTHSLTSSGTTSNTRSLVSTKTTIAESTKTTRTSSAASATGTIPPKLYFLEELCSKCHIPKVIDKQDEQDTRLQCDCAHLVWDERPKLNDFLRNNDGAIGTVSHGSGNIMQSCTNFDVKEPFELTAQCPTKPTKNNKGKTVSASILLGKNFQIQVGENNHVDSFQATNKRD